MLDWNWGAKAALFYAGTNLLCNLWCWFRLPETKDRSFGEIDLLFDNKVAARKWKYTNVDRKSICLLGSLTAYFSAHMRSSALAIIGIEIVYRVRRQRQSHVQGKARHCRHHNRECLRE